MLKSALTGACLYIAALAMACQAQARELTGPQITALIAGATIEIETPTGTRIPVRYTQEGKIEGDARDLAWYLGSATDRGKWWVDGDKLCHKWLRWFNSEPQCMRLSREGRAIRWLSLDGYTGLAMVTVPAVAQAAAVPAMGSLLAKRFADPPAAEPAPKLLGAPAKQELPSDTGAAIAGPMPPPAPKEIVAAVPPTLTPPPAPVLVSPPKQVSAAAAPEPPPAAVEKRAEPKVALSPAPAPAERKSETYVTAGAERKAAPVHRQPDRPTFMVTNVRHDDVLNVRSGPSSDHDIVGELPPGSRGIAITSECRARWCPVQHDKMTGWVNSAFLSPEALPAALQDRAVVSPAVRDSAEAPRTCLTPPARRLLDRIEQTFGPVQVISTCRAGAVIAGTARLSRHASGNAVDFKAGARKAAILEWLIANHRAGGIMTYAGMDHIHVDIGPRFVSIAGGPHWSSWRQGN
jgi:hypothetical protein